jgi:hypothetical protein
LAWGQQDGRAKDVARFHAGHGSPFIIAEIGERRRSLLPGIPHDGGCGILFVRPQGPMQVRVNQFNGVVNIEVCIVCRAAEDDIAGLSLLAIPIRVIKVRDLIEAANAYIPHLAHLEVRMQSLLKG